MNSGTKADPPGPGKREPGDVQQSQSFVKTATKRGVGDDLQDSQPTLVLTPAPTPSVTPVPTSRVQSSSAKAAADSNVWVSAPPEDVCTRATAHELAELPFDGALPVPRPAAERLQLQPGAILEGSYLIGKVLGEGGMGVVLHARDQNLQRDVAIKLIQPNLLLADSVRESFRKEAQAMARVHHQNVVMIHAFGEVKQVPYFVMEFVDGIDVEALQDARLGKPLGRDDVLKIMTQAAAGIDAIHAAGAIHLDLKPSNVLIGEGFRVVVTDLGIARVVEHDSTNEAIAGTPNYMAPETIAGAEPAPAADIYALAVMAYELFTGKLPFGMLFTPAAVLATLKRTPQLPSEVNPELPTELDDVILTGLSKNPSARPKSAGEFAQTLRDAVIASQKNPQWLSFLVADDDPDMRELAVAMLEEIFPKPRIRVASDGAEALKMLCEEPAGLALIDLQMPGLNGLELTAELRGREATRAMPIIVMTAVGGASDWRLLASLGANAFLVKPFDEMQLEMASRRLMGIK